MLNQKSFLAVDFGAGTLKLAEFEVNEAGGLRLKQYGIKSLGPEGSQEATREATILKALQAMLAEKAVKSKGVKVAAPGSPASPKLSNLLPANRTNARKITHSQAK